MIRDNAKILIVDDFQMVRFMLKDALKQLHLTHADEASDGKEALEMLMQAMNDNQPYDLVFCDWNMPEMDGIELLKVIRKTHAMAHLPFILVTAEADEDAVSNALSAGASDYITKPFSSDSLREKLEALQKSMKKAS